MKKVCYEEFLEYVLGNDLKPENFSETKLRPNLPDNSRVFINQDRKMKALTYFTPETGISHYIDI